MSTYLTKSKFVRALDCPTKLYYKQNEEYKSTLEDNDFLQALAKGGLQVGELAKLYFPGGRDIPMRQEKTKSLSQTEVLLQQESTTIYEAAIQHDNCFILVDVLKKEGNRISLIEVKSKSWGPDTSFFYKRKDGIRSKWQPYLFDIAFQTWVTQKAYPDYQIEPYLMLIDKTQQATVDGLHQFFKVVEENGRSEVRIKKGVKREDLGKQILKQIHVGGYVDQILEGNGRKPKHELEAEGFEEWVQRLSQLLKTNNKYPVQTGYKCKNCEYRIDTDELAPYQKSGFQECWKEAHQWQEDDFEQPHIFDIWNEHHTKAKGYLEDGVYKMEERIPGMLKANPERLYDKSEWDNGQRQTVQIMKATGHHPQNEEVLTGLFQEMENWTYPLHFIDFEAVLASIPFHKGLYPYDYVPFQFSCHTMYKNGEVEHRKEWIEKEPGKLPSIEFVRQLKKCLEGDDGTVFRYHYFENTVLGKMAELIKRMKPSGENELLEFIGSLTRDGRRAMVDQHRLTKRYYYSHFTNGSISIKDVLPAVLNESPRLEQIYSQPYNGLSMKDKVLYRVDEETDTVLSPYKLLDPIGYGMPDYETGEEYVADGGTAMMTKIQT